MHAASEVTTNPLAKRNDMTLNIAITRRLRAGALVLPALLFLAALPAPAAEKHSGRDMKAMVANAKTPADHLKLAEHYREMAAQHEADAKEHEALAAEYAKLGATAKTPMSGKTAEHCRYFAEHCREAAKALRSMAADHEEMAKKTGK
jgi:hypothetical protein